MKGTKQILLYAPIPHWAEILQESAKVIHAIADDGVTVAVVRDGTERIRHVQ